MKWQTKVCWGGGVEQNSRGVKHFLKRVKKNLGGFNPPNPPPPPRKSAHDDPSKRIICLIDYLSSWGSVCSLQQVGRQAACKLLSSSLISDGFARLEAIFVCISMTTDLLQVVVNRFASMHVNRLAALPMLCNRLQFALNRTAAKPMQSKYSYSLADVNSLLKIAVDTVDMATKHALHPRVFNIRKNTRNIFNGTMESISFIIQQF